MLTSQYLLLALSAIAFAQPTLRPRDNDSKRDDFDIVREPSTWSPKMKNYYQAMGKHIVRATDLPHFPDAPDCDLSKASPSVGTSPHIDSFPSLIY
jgi:hypothetical protein